MTIKFIYSVRLLAIDIIMFDQRFKLIVNYMPHSSLPDEPVEQLYDQMTVFHAEAITKGRTTVIGGDGMEMIDR